MSVLLKALLLATLATVITQVQGQSHQPLTTHTLQSLHLYHHITTCTHTHSKSISDSDFQEEPPMSAGVEQLAPPRLELRYFIPAELGQPTMERQGAGLISSACQTTPTQIISDTTMECKTLLMWLESSILLHQPLMSTDTTLPVRCATSPHAVRR